MPPGPDAVLESRAGAAAGRASSRAIPTARSGPGLPHPLGPYPERITDRLDHWADAAPDRTFLAAARRRRRLAPTDLRRRRIAACAASRRRCSTAACRAIAPSSSCPATASSTPCSRSPRCTRRAVRAGRSRLFAAGRSDHGTLRRARATSMRPDSSSPPTAPRSSRRCAMCAERRSRSSRRVAAARACRATPLRRARGGDADRRRRRRARARDRRHDREGAVHVGIDRAAQGRHQHAAHAVREPGT